MGRVGRADASRYLIVDWDALGELMAQLIRYAGGPRRSLRGLAKEVGIPLPTCFLYLHGKDSLPTRTLATMRPETRGRLRLGILRARRLVTAEEGATAGDRLGYDLETLLQASLHRGRRVRDGWKPTALPTALRTSDTPPPAEEHDRWPPTWWRVRRGVYREMGVGVLAATSLGRGWLALLVGRRPTAARREAYRSSALVAIQSEPFDPSPLTRGRTWRLWQRNRKLYEAILDQL